MSLNAWVETAIAAAVKEPSLSAHPYRGASKRTARKRKKRK
jgi:hypothetical protein